MSIDNGLNYGARSTAKAALSLTLHALSAAESRPRPGLGCVTGIALTSHTEQCSVGDSCSQIHNVSYSKLYTNDNEYASFYLLLEDECWKMSILTNILMFD